MAQSLGVRARGVKIVRKLKREMRLKSLCPTRRCPCCGHLKLKSRSWVIVARDEVLKWFRKGRLAIPTHGLVGSGREVAVCRSCIWKARHGP